MFRPLLFLLFPGMLAFAEEQQLPWEPPKTAPVIKAIHIEALDAFDPRIPEYRSWPFRFLNHLHNRTNDSFIRRELLFREGDLFDPDLLEESERNLRRKSFLDDVRIETIRLNDREVEMKVHTEDQWTLQANISAGKSSGVSTFEFSIEESNFLGLGKTVGLGYERTAERTIYNFLYYDPQFLNTRWLFKSDYQNNSDGWRYISDIVRPFYSLDTRWAYGIAWDSGKYSRPLYTKGGKAVAEIDTDHRTGIFFLARSWGERYDKRRLGFVFNTDSVFYPNPVRIILPEATSVKQIRRNLLPRNRETYQFGAIFQIDRQNFIEQRYLDNFGKIEDLPVGFQLASMLTYSQTVNPNPNYYQLHTILQYHQQLNPSNYFSLRSQFSARKEIDGPLNNIVFDTYAHYYLKMPELRLGKILFPRQTLAANLSATLTHEVDAPFQISLGEDEGLRGYTFKSFTGQNRVLLNVEDRIFTPWNFRLVGIGLVAFLDAGYVWSSEEHLRLNDLGISAGAGLRIGLKKSQSARVLRIDFAVPLRDETSRFTEADKKGYSISVSSGQIFKVIEALPKLFQLF